MENKVILVTGAARRIGREIAINMAKSGWDVALHYNNSEGEAVDVAKIITGYGAKCCLIKADLRDEQQLKTILPQAAALGNVTCLVNNASVFHNDTIQNVTRASWQENMQVNLYAPTILMQEFVKNLPQNQPGNIINMLDYAVWRYPEKFLSYTASKAALWTLTQQLAMALAPRKIRVNGIGPGRILHNPYDNAESFANAVQSAPLGYDSSPAEICNTVKFIIASPAMTGQMIALDGGKHLIGPEAY